MPQGEVRGEGGRDQEGISRQLGPGRSWINKVFLPRELGHLLTPGAAIPWRPYVRVLSHVCLFVIPWTVPARLLCGIFQARILDWVAISNSRESFQLRIKPTSPAPPALARGFFTTMPPGLPPLPTVYLKW